MGINDENINDDEGCLWVNIAKEVDRDADGVINFENFKRMIELYAEAKFPLNYTKQLGEETLSQLQKILMRQDSKEEDNSFSKNKKDAHLSNNDQDEIASSNSLKEFDNKKSGQHKKENNGDATMKSW